MGRVYLLKGGGLDFGLRGGQGGFRDVFFLVNYAGLEFFGFVVHPNPYTGPTP